MLFYAQVAAHVVRDWKAREGPWTGKMHTVDDQTPGDTVQTVRPMRQHLYDGFWDNEPTSSEAYNNLPCGAGRGPDRIHACARWDTGCSSDDP